MGKPSTYLALKAKAIGIISSPRLYERNHILFLKEVVPEGSAATDVGANCGAYTMELSKLVGKTVIAFEPNPMVFEAMRKNVVRGNNVTCLQLALSNTANPHVTLQMPLLFGRIPEPANASLGVPLTEQSGAIYLCYLDRDRHLRVIEPASAMASIRSYDYYLVPKEKGTSIVRQCD
jgi:hypothetical protein